MKNKTFDIELSIYKPLLSILSFKKNEKKKKKKLIYLFLYTLKRKVLAEIRLLKISQENVCVIKS